MAGTWWLSSVGGAALGCADWKVPGISCFYIKVKCCLCARYLMIISHGSWHLAVSGDISKLLWPTKKSGQTHGKTYRFILWGLMILNLTCSSAWNMPFLVMEFMCEGTGNHSGPRNLLYSLLGVWGCGGPAPQRDRGVLRRHSLLCPGTCSASGNRRLWTLWHRSQSNNGKQLLCMTHLALIIP